MKAKLTQKAIDFIKEKEKVSVREISEHIEIGYNKASEIIDVLESNGIISKFSGETHRNIIVDKSYFENNFIFLNINDFID